jgi:hypothetical protein
VEISAVESPGFKLRASLLRLGPLAASLRRPAASTGAYKTVPTFLLRLGVGSGSEATARGFM